MDELGDNGSVTPLERLPTSETARLPPVFGALRLYSVRGTSTSCWGVSLAVGDPIGGGPVFVNSCWALSRVGSCRTRSRGGVRVSMRGDVGMGALGTRRDFVASEILQDCCQSIENGAHGGNENEKGEVIKRFKRCRCFALEVFRES